ncbi:MAG TPA: zinc ABC transporter substrate-binding protein [Dehalococcoidia bacterium]|nr:zinc ABC transporter substrate-binding protein [Dehalococcoidia bacterium]
MFARPLVILSRNRFVRGVLLMALAGAVACRGGNAGVSGAGSSTVNVVAAENFYGDLVKQLGGPAVKVTSIISDPNADPHEYESSSGNAKAIAAARLVIVNGAGYDSFMDKLLAASPNRERKVVNAAGILGKKDGDNPHVWYDVSGMQQVADQITQALQELDPAGSDAYAMRNQRFKASLQPLLDRMGAIRAKYAGTHLTQTEPVFGYMGDALGLTIDDGEFQHAIEEGNDPSPQAVAAINQEISTRSVRALLYNSQTTNPTTTNLKNLAKQNNVPIVGVSETEPPNETYQGWMLSQLSALQTALGG